MAGVTFYGRIKEIMEKKMIHAIQEGDPNRPGPSG